MKNVLFAVTVKQLIVFPLAPLYNAAKFAYAWLNLFLFFKSCFWTNIHWVCLKICTCFLKSSISIFIFEMSTLFILLDYCIIILIYALYNPYHCLFVRTNRGEFYAWFDCIDSFKTVHYIVAILHLKALEHFTFFCFFCLYMHKTSLYASCYLAFILALYMYKLCVAGPFKYRCYVED